MTVETLNEESALEVALLMQAVDRVNVWLARGDGVAVYQNQDMGHPALGETRLVSYGSPTAQLETDDPPVRLPDIGYAINWRYQLVGVYRGSVLPTEREGTR